MTAVQIEALRLLVERAREILGEVADGLTSLADVAQIEQAGAADLAVLEAHCRQEEGRRVVIATVQIEARIIAASLTTSRFRGRTALLAFAEQGDEDALRALEMTSRAREITALRGELSRRVVDALDLPEVREQARIRAERAARAAAHRDALADRAPGNVPERATRRAFARALKIAEFRTAKHSHARTLAVVERGREGASSESGAAWPRDVGLPDSYCRGTVATSAHAWRVSPAIFRAPAPDQGVLYLAPDLRVRQGRGTSLVVERRAAGRWTA